MLTCSKGGHNQITKQLLAVAKKTKQEKREARGFFRVSETTKCGRKLWYGKIGEKPTNPFRPDTLIKMEIGDVLHNWIRGELIPRSTKFKVTNWDMDKANEEYLEGSFQVGDQTVNLGGHIDGILRDSKKKALAVLEVKTAGKFSYFGTVKAGCLDPKHWSNGYAKQANDYVALWNLNHPKDKVTKFCIFVFNTDCGADKETEMPFRDYWFNFDPDLFQERLEFRAEAQRQAALNGLPNRAYTNRDEFECTGCLWYSQCWSV